LPGDLLRDPLIHQHIHPAGLHTYVEDEPKAVVLMQQWWWRMRPTIRAILFPLICLQFARTLFFPNPFDVFLLFAMFLLYLGILFGVV
jgi:hypothetical protein